MFASIRSDWRQHGAAWLTTALTTLLGLQMLRALFVGFVGYLRDSVGYGSLELAPIAIGVFAVSLLAGVINRFAGTRNTLWITAGGLALVRIVEQLLHNPTIDLYLSMVGTVLFLMYIPVAVGVARARGGAAGANLGLAFLFGLTIDNVIFITNKTLDLSWQTGFLPLGIVLVLAGALLWALSRIVADAPAAHDGNWVVNLGLLALGPWLLVQVVVFQSVGMIASLTGLALPAAGGLLLAGNALGLGSSAGLGQNKRGAMKVLLAGLVMTVVMLPGNMAGSGWSWLLLLIGGFFSFRVGMLIFIRATGVAANPSLLRSSLLAGLGNILFVLLIFVYYASYDISFGLRSGQLLLVVGGLATLFATLAHLGARSSEKHELSRTPAWTAAALLLITLAMSFTWVLPDPATGSPASVRIVNYNLHNAANAHGAIDPEALAQLIESEGADIVGLQEVSRGWLIWGGMDMMEWLANRLGMHYVWGPTADAQWGNAVLSRYPIDSVTYYDLLPEDLLLRRGFIVAEIDLGANQLDFIATHFTHVDEHDQERNIQASGILDVWAGAGSTVFVGDLNALPDSHAIQILIEGGLVDVSREIGEQPVYTYSSTNPDHQIDYIFVSPDLGYSDFVVPATTASDHLPLAVTIHFEQ